MSMKVLSQANIDNRLLGLVCWLGKRKFKKA